MTREPPPNSQSMSDRVRNLSRAHGLAEGRVRRLLGVVIVGQLLVRTDAAVVKGATNLEVRLGTAGTRVSSDLDAVRRLSLVQFRDDLAVALRDGWHGFAGTLIDAGQIPTPTPDDYRPHRFRALSRSRRWRWTSRSPRSCTPAPHRTSPTRAMIALTTSSISNSRSTSSTGSWYRSVEPPRDCSRRVGSTPGRRR